jgi:sialate O-acetylesterase
MPKHHLAGSISFLSPPKCVRCVLAVFLVSLAAGELRADVRLPGFFSDNMVLQQGIEVPVWGWAGEGEQITVRFRKQKAATIAHGGKWMVRLKKLKAGGPDTLSIEGNNKIALNNVLVGEVWVCSGQSNMEWPMRLTDDAPAAIANSANDQVRLFTVPKLKALAPTNDVPSNWRPCQPEHMTNFSAVAYYFGRALQQARRVPVGLIHTSWGGSPAEVWMSEDVLRSNPDYKRDILDSFASAERSYKEALAKFEKDKAEATKAGRAFEGKAPQPPFWRPTELYNGMIAPLLPFAIKGAIWYQGESNAGRAWQYRTLFADMIRNWRRDWGQGDFPFLAVQLAPWDRNKKRSLEEITKEPVESDWAELREAQVIVAQTLPKVGLAVITDVGDKDDIHPRNKKPVGERLALAARAIAYGEKVVYSGPLYRALQVKGNEAWLSFDHVGRGLEARGGALQGFAICGAERKWVWAKAEIRGDQVVVSSPEVTKPVAVRYGWADHPVVNLWHKDGLPASPFRTDDFPMVSAPKK